MSGFISDFNERLHTLLQETVTDFLKQIHERYDIPLDELNEIRLGAGSSTVKELAPLQEKTSEASELINHSTVVLKAMCKTAGKKNYSRLKKIELISLLTSSKVTQVIPITKKSAKHKKIKKEIKTPDVVKNKIISSEVKIRRNNNGDYMHTETGLIFDKDTKQVISRYYPSEGNRNLTEEDVDACKQYNFSYVLPENLVKKGQTNVSEDKDDKIEDLGIPAEDLKSDEDVDLGFGEEEVVDEEEEVVDEEEEVVDEEEEEVVDEEEEEVVDELSRRRRSCR